MRLRINGKYYEVDTEPEETLLHVLKNHLHFFGSVDLCGKGECGACIVLVNNKAQKACHITVGSLSGDRVRTIEGIPEKHPVKEAWKCEGVPACNYCKSGQIMRAIALLSRMLNPSAEDIKEALNTDQCNCGENPKIVRAINKASKYSYDS
jgi:aerobic-type carbon monoxide dehydrogenase small subunit (CoxS/CutS family)